MMPEPPVSRRSEIAPRPGSAGWPLAGRTSSRMLAYVVVVTLKNATFVPQLHGSRAAYRESTYAAGPVVSPAGAAVRVRYRITATSVRQSVRHRRARGGAGPGGAGCADLRWRGSEIRYSTQRLEAPAGARGTG
jgi:hypothetical protein